MRMTTTNYLFPSDVVIAAAAPEDIGTLAQAETWVLTAPNPDFANLDRRLFQYRRRVLAEIKETTEN